jgi:hypothetical protein
LRLESGAQRLRRVRILEVDPPVRERRERLVGEGDQLGDGHPGIGLDADDVEVVVARELGRPHDRAVLPRLEHVAHERMQAVVQGARAFLAGGRA